MAQPRLRRTKPPSRRRRQAKVAAGTSTTTQPSSFTKPKSPEKAPDLALSLLLQEEAHLLHHHFVSAQEPALSAGKHNEFGQEYGTTNATLASSTCKTVCVSQILEPKWLRRVVVVVGIAVTVVAVSVSLVVWL